MFSQLVLSQNHRLQNLVRYTGCPLITHEGILLLCQRLPQESVAIFHNVLHVVAEAHCAHHVRRHGRPAVHDPVVVEAHHATLRPIELTRELLLLNEAGPEPIGCHELIVHVEGQCGDAALGLRLHDLLQVTIGVQRDDGMSVHELEDLTIFRARRVGPVLAVDVVSAAVGEVDSCEDLVLCGVVVAHVIVHRQAVAHLGLDRALSLVHELVVARRAIVDGVVGVHGQRVGVVVVSTVLLGSGPRVHDAIASCAHRVLIKSPDDFSHEILHGHADVLVLQGLGGS
mmetsp:Transcript_98177/g.210550  ORF Transcript_98177/g.210550 Transcript_98177/m.210550 type:complete len:285 (+) Transcript_98177:539-1393(+)